MVKFIFIRLAQAIPVLFIVITATFFLIRSAPGGPFDSEKAVLPEVKRALEAQYNLDLPLYQQYLSYLGDLAQGDLGPSFKYPGRSVNEVLESGLPVTFELGLYALGFALFVGVLAGVVASLRPNTSQDYIPMGMAMIGICMPSFLLGPLMVLVFGIYFEWLPIAGWGDLPGDKILPSITLGSAYAAYIARLLSTLVMLPFLSVHSTQPIHMAISPSIKVAAVSEPTERQPWIPNPLSPGYSLLCPTKYARAPFRVVRNVCSPDAKVGLNRTCPRLKP